MSNVTVTLTCKQAMFFYWMLINIVAICIWRVVSKYKLIKKKG